MVKLTYNFHNPNTDGQAAEEILKLCLAACEKKLDAVLKKQLASSQNVNGQQNSA